MSGATHPAPRWHHAPQAMALCAWRDSHLARLAAMLDDALLAWAADWGLGVLPRVRCTTASCWARRETAWRLLGCSGAGDAWMQLGEDPGDRAWLGALAARTPVALAVAHRCSRDVQARLQRLAGLESASCESEVPPATWSAWSGAVIAELPLSSLLLLSAGLVRRLLGASSPVRAGHPLAPAAEVISHRTVRLQVELEGCQLSLGELASLQAGDVLRLRHTTETPATVRAPAGEVLFDGWLARSRDRRAIELAGHGPLRAGQEGAPR